MNTSPAASDRRYPAAAVALAGNERRKSPSCRVLLIGGAGYIGVPLARRLLDAGRAVRILDRLVYQNGASVLGWASEPASEFVFGDMADSAAMDRALDGVTDVVILAGLVGDPITKKFPGQAEAINERALRHCIDQLNGRGINKVVFISTCSNYGMIPEDELADEDFPLNPLSLYANAKVKAETYLMSLKGHVDYHATVLRFATAFGLAPRMRFDLTVNEFARTLFLGSELVVYDADTWRPYCHVRDFARLVLRVLGAPPPLVSFEIFNAGGEANNLTKRRIVDLALEHLPPGRRVSYRENSADRRNYRVDFGKVRTTLDFEPEFDVAYGIDEIIRALHSHLLDDVDARPNFYGNHDLPGLTVGVQPRELLGELAVA
jgi:nucleoside-diphosphate-sugar epimerase